MGKSNHGIPGGCVVVSPEGVLRALEHMTSFAASSSHARQMMRTLQEISAEDGPPIDRALVRLLVNVALVNANLAVVAAHGMAREIMPALESGVPPASRQH